MSEKYFLVVIVLAVLYILFRRAGQISQKAAAEYLKNGALVLDVRSAAEFESGHLTQAINMPLDQIEALASVEVKDKSRVMLLHCQSGIRSRSATKRLANVGYTNVFNLGSYERAFRIASGRRL
jgi:rhodanese-related sulfurtransferase